MRAFRVMDALGRGLFGTPRMLAILAQLDSGGGLHQPSGHQRQAQRLKHRPVLRVQDGGEALGARFKPVNALG